MVDNEFLVFLLYGSLSYFLGSIPFGYLFVKYAGLGDVRDSGSGNIGSTNVMRTGRKELAALTFACDFLKGYLPVILTPSLVTFHAPLETYVGIIAVLGHIFPFWLSFKGGKGVATAAGVLSAISAPFAFICFGIWGLFFFLFKKSSLAGLITTALAFILSAFWDPTVLIMCSVLTPLIAWTHRSNIHRLLHKQENDLFQPKM